jgi:hypothetical protein
MERRDLLDHQRGVLDRAPAQDVSLSPGGEVLEEQDDTAVVVDGGVVERRGERRADLAVEAFFSHAAFVIAAHEFRITFLKGAVSRDGISLRHRQLRDQ